MSQTEYSTSPQTLKAGEIQTRQTSRGIEFHAYNLERGKTVFVGTKKGDVYETVKPIFRQWQTFNLTQAEFAAILETDTRIITIIPPDRSGTYSIEVERFARYAQPYEHPSYGRQLACPLKYFASSSKVEPRNARRDNPTLETVQPIAPREKSKQPKQLGFSRLFDR